MNIQENITLSNCSTLRLGGKARFFVVVGDEDQLEEAASFAMNKDLRIHVVGDGTNTVFGDEGFDGLVIKNEIEGFALDERGLLTAGSGENWDETVSTAVDEGWSGIEALSLIPGTVGAAPVQNIGGYGQELSETFVSLRAYDVENHNFIIMDKVVCEFDYRSSMLKKNPGRYIVTQVCLQLRREQIKPPFYTTLQKYFDEHSVTEFTPKNIRKAVVAWRSSYLPDPTSIKTVGSFFVNPVIDRSTLDGLIRKHPELNDSPTKWYWPQTNDSYKIAAGRLADTVGLKDFHDQETGMATWKNSALILVNESAKSYAQLDQFRRKYLEKIEQAYGITFEQEPVEV